MTKPSESLKRRNPKIGKKGSQAANQAVKKTLAKDIMNTNLIVVTPDHTYRDAVELLTAHRLTGLPVVDQNYKLLGLISERDILKATKQLDEITSSFLDKKIDYRNPIKSARLTVSLSRIHKILIKNPFRHIPIVDLDNKLCGIITRRDLIRIIYLRIELNSEDLSEI